MRRAGAKVLVRFSRYAIEIDQRLTNYVADAALSAKLQEELQCEKEAEVESSGEPEFLKAFKAQGIWAVSYIPRAYVCAVTERGWPGGIDRRQCYS